MTGQPLQQLDDPNTPRDSPLYKHVTAMNNRHGVRHDLEALCKFVRETLFYAMIHDARGSGTNPNDEVMGENGKACQIFVHVFLRDKEKISNTEMLDSTLEEREQYLKFLWREGLQTKGRYNIRKALSNEKSAVYAGISESFKSKCKNIPLHVTKQSELKNMCCCSWLCTTAKELVHDCSVNKVPFPALETLEDRKRFPTRYFLFFDVFVRAGRHNRYLWKKVIRENKGLNDKRFGPAIFEAHVRTTVHENYFKWIFQQLSDIHEVEDEDVEAFQMEYDENIYTNLPRTLVCTHKDLTKFPFKNCEIDYGEDFISKNPASSDEDDEDTEKGDDDDSYLSANSRSGVEPVAARANLAEGSSQQPENAEKKFFLVYKNVNANRFNEIREQQRKDLTSTIERTRSQHKDILNCLKDTIKTIREVKKTLPENDQRYKEAIAEAKKKLRLFKDPYEEDTEGPSRKKRRRSIENQTRFSDSKVTFFSKANDSMKQEEQQGLRKSWEALYKEIWNKHLLIPKIPVIDIPIPQVHSIIRDMENDVNQLLEDCAGMVEQV
jgi:hypothetical protein